MDNWPQIVFRARVRSLAEALGASCAWISRLLPAGLSSPVGLVVLCLYYSSAWEVFSCIGIAHSKNLCEEYIVRLEGVGFAICCVG